MAAKRNPGAGRPRKPKATLPTKPDGTPVSLGQESGLRAAIERLRAAEIRAAEDYELARTTEDPGLIQAKKKDWLDLTEQLRKVEVSTPDVRKANAETLPIADVERETARMVNAFRVALEALPRSLPQRLIGQDEAGIMETLSQAIADALGQLHTDKWKS